MRALLTVLNRSEHSMQKYASLLLAATLLALPLSSTGKSICFILAIVTILLTPAYRTDLLNILSESWCKAPLLLFLIALIACFWSPANWVDQKFALDKYSKLLYLPILAVGFQDSKTRTLSLHAFLLAMFITAVLSSLKFHGYLSSLDFDPDKVFRNHIMTGFMVAFAVYLSSLFAYRSEKIILKISYGLLSVLLSYHVLFVNSGRTGYLVYFILMSILIIQLCSWKTAILGVLLVPFALASIYFCSPMMKHRMDAIWHEAQNYHMNKNTDLGYRVQFQSYAHSLFKHHPLVGNGTASFTYYFEKENPVPEWPDKLLEPHSQYWLVASEFGLLGLCCLFLFFIQLIRTSFQLKEMKCIAFAMFIPFLIGNLSDSLLFYSGSGYFFILFMALCFGERINNPLKLNDDIEKKQA